MAVVRVVVALVLVLAVLAVVMVFMAMAMIMVIALGLFLPNHLNCSEAIFSHVFCNGHVSFLA
jgi:hypothetical protein